jgi:ABC-type transporter Mla subunit MlaD
MVAEDYEGTLSSSMDTLCSAAELAQRVSQNVDTARTQTQALTDLINTYHPEVQQALSDAQTFTRSASPGISALVDAAKATEALAKESEPAWIKAPSRPSPGYPPPCASPQRDWGKQAPSETPRTPYDASSPTSGTATQAEIKTCF